jgi:hypothetical protein
MKKLFLLSMIAVLLGACTTSSYTLVNNKVLNNADLASYKTFKIITPSEGTLPPKMTLTDYNNIAGAVKSELINRGYTENTSNPDLLVNLGLYVATNVETKDALPPAYGPYFIGPRADYYRSYYDDAQIISGIEKDGMLALDLVDAKKNLHVYAATVKSILDGSGNNIKDLTQVQKAVSVLFSKYPVPGKTSTSK